MRNKDLGFNTDQVIYTSMQGCNVEKYKSLKAEMKRIPHVRNVTASFQLPMNIGSSPGEMKWEGKQADQDVRINAGLVDYDYFETFGMKIVDGRAFSEERSSSGSVEYVVNESAVKAMGMKNPIGKTFSFWDSLGTIVGVVKDFNSQPLYKPVNPIVLKLDPYWLNYVYVRIDPVDAQATINSISNTWSQITGGFPFDFHFLDESIDNQYRAEQRVSSVLKYFTVFATFVACLGLFGLASFMAGQRTKEIGIRKVFGASSFSVLVLISREFVLLVLLANVIAWPFAYYFTEQWLQDYAYRTTIGVDVFLIAGSIALLTAILSVVAQSTRASRANPVHSLRHE
jgi:putative ABC transport system permease protein